MKTNEEKANAAAEVIGAEKMAVGWVYFDDNARKYYLCESEEEMADLYDLQNSDDEYTSHEAYSHWCAQTNHSECSEEGVTVTYADVVDLKTHELDEDTLVVDDGTYKWLADRKNYEEVMGSYVDRVREGDEAEADYYTDFCNRCKSLDRTNKERAKEAKALYRESQGNEPN